MHQVVIHYSDGRLVKGLTDDFQPERDRFHLAPPEAVFGAPPREVRLADAKAVYFVKSLSGNARRRKLNDPPARRPPGRTVRVVFRDGEVMVGTTPGLLSDRPGFFLTPVDPGSNNERCFVLVAAVKELETLSVGRVHERTAPAAGARRADFLSADTLAAIPAVFTKMRHWME